MQSVRIRKTAKILVFIVFFGVAFMMLSLKARPKVAVVGAGLAGLTTAYRLIQQGYDVTLYEARERLGGRVFTVYLEDDQGTRCPVELGGEWIDDGGDAENLLKLAHELKVPIAHTKRTKFTIYWFDGTQAYDPRRLMQRYHFSPESLGNALMELSKNAQNMDDILKELFAEDDILYQIFRMRLHCYEGGAPEQLSPCYFTTLYRTILPTIIDIAPQGDSRYILGGNGELIKALVRALGARIHTRKVVTQVGKKDSGEFTLTFADGKVVQADILVLAMPCSVYKNITFSDQVIPDDRLRAFQEVGYGENARIVIPAVKAQLSLAAYLNEHVIAYRRTQESPIVVYCAGAYAHFNATNLAKSVDDILPLARLLSTPVPDAEKPRIARDKQGETYRGIVTHSWPEDPFAQGSYSYIRAGYEEVSTAIEEYRGEKVRSLFAPCKGCYFAGEHATILLDVLGTMEAAVESGERVARIVAADYAKT